VSRTPCCVRLAVRHRGGVSSTNGSGVLKGNTARGTFGLGRCESLSYTFREQTSESAPPLLHITSHDKRVDDIQHYYLFFLFFCLSKNNHYVFKDVSSFVFVKRERKQAGWAERFVVSFSPPRPTRKVMQPEWLPQF